MDAGTKIEIDRQKLEQLIDQKKALEKGLKTLVLACAKVGEEVKKLTSLNQAQLIGLIAKPDKIKSLIGTIQGEIIPEADRWLPYFLPENFPTEAPKKDVEA